MDEQAKLQQVQQAQWQDGRTPSFRAELEQLINKHSMENGSDTPDFLLADFLWNCLNIFDHTIRNREAWYGRDESSGQAGRG